MIVLTKRIELPDNATYEMIEDAKITADLKGWDRKDVLSIEQRKARTDLTNKCGSCIFFKQKPMCGSTVYGTCDAGHPFGQRTRKACRDYERNAT